MIEMKLGKINEIVYQHTVLLNGDIRKCLTTTELVSLINKIIEMNDTCSYLRFTPFYRNFKFNDM